MSLFRALGLSLLLALGTAIAAADANAASIGIADDGSGSLGSYEGTISYDGTGLLTIDLTNTSPADNGGFLTGFVFNVNGDATATLSPSQQHNFSNVENKKNNAAPFGTFEAGAAIGGNWNGGGNPSGGIAVGDSASFTFNVTGAEAPELNAMDFITEPGKQDVAFAVRFRGFDDGGSDKVPAVAAPSPAAAGAGLVLLGGLLMRRRATHRRRSV